MTRQASRVHPDADDLEAALRHLRAAVQQGRHQPVQRVFDQLADLGLPWPGRQEALEAALSEIGWEHGKPPDQPFDPPGHAFVWQSKWFGRRTDLKFRLEGKKPVCVIHSLHAAAHRERNPS